MSGYIFVLVILPLAILLALLAYLLRPERYAEQALQRRPLLDDRAFYERFYAQTGIPEDIPIRLRQVYAEQFGRAWGKVYPRDNVVEIFDDLDLAELLCEVEDEFGVSFPDEVGRNMDGTFDAIVRYLAEERSSRG
jgi:acyl carrier protein